MATRWIAFCALVASLWGCGQSVSDPPVNTSILATQDDAKIRELIVKIEDYSERSIDIPVVTPADRAADELLRIGRPAVPNLLTELKSPKPWGRVHSMEILAKLHEPSAVKPILEILRSDPEEGVRGVAAYVLGQFNDRSVLPDLRKAAVSKDHHVARSAWQSLGTLKDVESIPVLIQSLGKKTIAIPAMEITDPAPEEALVDIGTPSVRPLLEALPRLKEGAQMGAAHALARIGSGEAIAGLRSALNVRKTRGAAYEALLTSARGNVSDVALSGLSDPDLAVQAEAYFAQHPDRRCLPKVREHLLRVLKEGRWIDAGSPFATLAAHHDRTCDDAVIAMLTRHPEDSTDLDLLADMRDPRAIPLLLSTVSARPSEYKKYRIESAAKGLALLGSAAIPPLLDHVRKRPQSAQWAGNVLSRMRDPAAKPGLLAVLHGKQPEALRTGAAEALREIGGSGQKSQQ